MKTSRTTDYSSLSDYQDMAPYQQAESDCRTPWEQRGAAGLPSNQVPGEQGRVANGQNDPMRLEKAPATHLPSGLAALPAGNGVLPSISNRASGAYAAPTPSMDRPATLRPARTPRVDEARRHGDVFEGTALRNTGRLGVVGDVGRGNGPELPARRYRQSEID
ncbi:hypothetical protein ACFJIX_20210 [Roseateles sp. UC29_93]|uniref:hypothetical protein n=1 Tax=Roseateles sp. UC29_93 TaxID=3350177 RepID=UPI00366C0D2D